LPATSPPAWCSRRPRPNCPTSRPIWRIRALDAEWQARTRQHGETFRRDLEEELTSGRRDLDLIKRRLALARSTLERKQRLSLRGNASQAEIEDAQALVVDLERLEVERGRAITEADIRYEAAEKGIFLTSDGGDPDWADRSRDALRLEIARASAGLAEAETAPEEARGVATAEAASLERISSAYVTAPAA
jgi:hypothetical protein